MDKLKLNVETLKNLINLFTKLSRLKRNIFSGVVYTVYNTLITFVAYPLYLTYLGAEKFGLWSTVTVIVAFCELGLIGIDTALIKYVASSYGKKDLPRISAYFSTAVYMLFVPSMMIISIILIFKSRIANFLKIDSLFMESGINLILAVGFLSVLSLFVSIVKGVVTGIGRFDLVNYVLILSRTLQITLAIVLLILDYGIWSLYYGYLLYLFIQIILWIMKLHKKYSINLFSSLSFNKEIFKELLRFGGTLITGSIARMLVIPFNKVIIAKFIGFTEVAYFEIAYRVVIATRSVFVNGLEALLPKVSEINEKSKESLKSVFSVHKEGMKFVLIFASPLFLMMYILSEQILVLWLREEFNVQIEIVLKVLLVGWYINALTVPDYYMFIGIGKVQYSVADEWIRSITNVLMISSLVLLKINLDLYYIAIISSISLLLGALFLKYKYYRLRYHGIF